MPTASAIRPASYSTSTATPAARPARKGRLLHASAKAPKPSAAAGTWLNPSIARPEATVPSAKVTSAAPPQPGASPRNPPDHEGAEQERNADNGEPHRPQLVLAAALPFVPVREPHDLRGREREQRVAGRLVRVEMAAVRRLVSRPVETDVGVQTSVDDGVREAHARDVLGARRHHHRQHRQGDEREQ